MQTDIDLLMQLNREINAAESKGDRNFLKGILASKLAFQRANDLRTIVDSEEFLSAVQQSSERDIVFESIQLYKNRAVVTCVVTTKSDGRKFHNIRLFVRRSEGWRLLGWANEPQ